MRVKICGMSTFADLSCDIAACADAIVFLMGLCMSPRMWWVTPCEAAAMIETLPPFVEPVVCSYASAKTRGYDLYCGTVALYNAADSGYGDAVRKEVREAVSYLLIMKAVHMMDAGCVRSCDG